MELDTKIKIHKYVDISQEFESESRFDGRKLRRKSVGDDKATGINTSIADGSITTAKLATDSVTKVKVSNDTIGNNELDYEEVSITVLLGQSSGTGTATSGSIIIGYYPTGNNDVLVDNVAISGTTVTITLSAVAIANNTFKVVLIKS